MHLSDTLNTLKIKNASDAPSLKEKKTYSELVK